MLDWMAAPVGRHQHCHCVLGCRLKLPKPASNALLMKPTLCAASVGAEEAGSMLTGQSLGESADVASAEEEEEEEEGTSGPCQTAAVTRDPALKCWATVDRDGHTTVHCSKCGTEQMLLTRLLTGLVKSGVELLDVTAMVGSGGDAVRLVRRVQAMAESQQLLLVCKQRSGLHQLLDTMPALHVADAAEKNLASSVCEQLQRLRIRMRDMRIPLTALECRLAVLAYKVQHEQLQEDALAEHSTAAELIAQLRQPSKAQLLAELPASLARHCRK